MERRFSLPETKKAHSKIVAKFSGVWKRKRLVQAVGEQDRMNAKKEGAMGRVMEMLVDASNIGAMGDLVDGASGVGITAGREGELWVDPFLQCILAQQGREGERSCPCICSNCGLIEFLS